MGRRGKGKKQMKKTRGGSGTVFWNREYDTKDHLVISQNPSADLQKFFRWLERFDAYYMPTRGESVTDVGCGNGRNIIYTCVTYGTQGIGYDLSREAITQAQRRATDHNCDITFSCRDVRGDIPAEDASQKLVLDMMVSHVLHKKEREHLLAEIYRVLEPGGFLFLKTFLYDGDLNARKLIAQFPGTEEGSYIHPQIGSEEHVFRQREIEDDVAHYFTIHKVHKSHKHRDRHGRANKRRSIVLYAQKPDLV